MQIDLPFPPPAVLPLRSPAAVLETAGGKGANLSRLARAGFHVPDGFILPTEAYRLFVAANRLGGAIQSALEGLTAADAAALESASTLIRSAFSRGEIPDHLQAAIIDGYAKIKDGPVAVRSSATTEDLPDLSFAGQQDTFLNILNQEQLLAAVVNCWSSLWTGRAIGYRLRNAIDQNTISLAVVVQRMVASQVSGVLFTANPLTGLRSETVIDAVFGLGEALVSGQVEPDQFIADSASGKIISRRLGGKQLITHPRPEGGVESLPRQDAVLQTLTPEDVGRLVALGRRVQAEYRLPQDIEWAFEDKQLYLLQARPITSLFPTPQVSYDPLLIWISFGAIQGLVGPMTPLGQDAIRYVAAGAGRMFGVTVNPAEMDLFAVAGERLWIKINDLLRNPVGSQVFKFFLESIEPSVGQILRQLAAEPRLGTGQGRLKLSSLRRLAGFFLPVALGALRTMLRPEAARAEFDAAIETGLADTRLPPAADRFTRLANAVAFIQEQVANALPFLLPRFLRIFAPAMGMLNLLSKLAGSGAGSDHGFSMLALEVTRGLPNNVTTGMDLDLWETAAEIKTNAEARRLFQAEPAVELAGRYRRGALPVSAQAGIARFLGRYGDRGLGEIDLGQPCWRDDPTPVMETLKSYLQIDPRFAPDLQFAQGRLAAQAAIDQIAAQAGRKPGGWLRARIVRGAARRVRALIGARESPKFFAIRSMGIARQTLLDVGAEFTQAGTIERPDDLFYLHLSELEALASRADQDWKALVADRRTAYRREQSRKQAPRVLVSDGRAFYEGVGAASDSEAALSGSPVSPGIVEGLVRVVLDPRQARLSPGEIMVCPGTDPGWTPLFLVAGGLITEVGGMMTHGSVVAREYGIPAVVGVHQATTRLKDGQRIRLDGSAGKIFIL
jgi:pyruvate,water dikinase